MERGFIFNFPKYYDVLKHAVDVVNALQSGEYTKFYAENPVKVEQVI